MSQGQGENKGGTYDLLWIMVLVAILIIFIWLVFSEPLKQFFINVRYVQLLILNFTIGRLPWFSELQNYLDFVATLKPGNLTESIVTEISYKIGVYYRWPCGLMLIGLIYLVYKKDVTIRYRKDYTMKTLSKQEWENWPHIKPVLDLDLVATDLDEGRWAMAQTPILFVRHNNLIKLEKKPATSLTDSDLYKPILNLSRAKGVFTAQLGKIFTQIEKMSIHRRALFSIFIGRICRDTEKSRALVAQLGGSYKDGKIDFTGVDSLWQKHIKQPIVQNLLKQHAYETTLLCSALLLARDDGVLPVAEIIWLKPIDRTLWYALGSVGRQTAFCEAAGVFAHWKAECRLKRALVIPMVEPAVKALEFALTEIIYKPTEAELQKLCAV